MFNAITIAVIIIVIAWGVAFIFAIMFWCGSHMSAWWTDIEELNKYCGSALEVETAWAISDFILDVVVIVMPMPMVRGTARLSKE